MFCLHYNCVLPFPWIWWLISLSSSSCNAHIFQLTTHLAGQVLPGRMPEVDYCIRTLVIALRCAFQWLQFHFQLQFHPLSLPRKRTPNPRVSNCCFLTALTDTIYKLNKWIFGHVCICVNIYKHAFFKFHSIQHELQCLPTRDSGRPPASVRWSQRIVYLKCCISAVARKQCQTNLNAIKHELEIWEIIPKFRTARIPPMLVSQIPISI